MSQLFKMFQVPGMKTVLPNQPSLLNAMLLT